MKKIVLGDETGNWVYVFIHTLNWFFRDADNWDINDDSKQRTIYQLPPKAGKGNEMTVNEPDFFRADQRGLYSVPWLLDSTEKSPGASKEKNVEEIKNLQISAAQNLKLIGVGP